MLELCKKVLTRVSFDRILFRKELLKALRWLNKQEAGLLRAWCSATFRNTHGEVIKEVFEQEPAEMSGDNRVPSARRSPKVPVLRESKPGQ